METPTLLDSGATENFMSLMYAKWLKLLFKHLPYEQPLLNVDGTTNKTGSLKYYVDLQVQTGTKRTSMRFFLTVFRFEGPIHQAEVKGDRAG